MKTISTLLLVLAMMIATNAQQQEQQKIPPIGIIDFYGLRKISEQEARTALPVKIGDVLPPSRADIEKRLVALLPGVGEASLSATCCESGRMILYIGIREKTATQLTFRRSPTGTIRLPPEIIKAGEEFAAAHQQAILAGDVGEDTSAGHSLMLNKAARTLQQKFIPIANQNLVLLRRVLRESSDASHRALAAEIIPYVDNKREIVSDLVNALTDEDGTVRNNAMRALGLIAEFGQNEPNRKIYVPFAPFINLLNSIVWTDRNKASLALLRLTEKRDKKLLAELKEKALPSLAEMSRWSSAGHSDPAFIILARVGGATDDEIQKSINDAERRRRLIDAIVKSERSK